MALFGPGVLLPAGTLAVPGEMPGTDLLVGPVLAELPFGHHHEARVGNTLVQLTVLEPGLAAVPELRTRLVNALERVQGLQHSSVLRLHGVVDTLGTIVVVREFPQGPSVRRWIHDHLLRQQRPDPLRVLDVIEHVATGVAAVQQTCVEPVLAHGFVGADTIFVVGEHHAQVGAAGEGGILPLTPSFARYLSSGLLPMIAPEIVGNPPRWLPQSDVYGVATLAVEMLVGRIVERPDPDLAAIGIPKPLLPLLTAATRGSLERRPRDLQVFREGLAEARVQLAPSIARPRALTPPPPPRARMLTPPSSGISSDPGSVSRPLATLPQPPRGGSGLTNLKEGSAAAAELAALDRATSRLLDSSGSTSVDTATQAVETTLAKARAPAPARSAPPPPPGTSPASAADTSISALGLAAARLAAAADGAEIALGTLDGAVTEVARVGTIASPRKEAPSGAARLTTSTSSRAADKPREYLLRRRGVDHGPYRLAELVALVEAGDLMSTERLFFDEEDLLAVDLPELRKAFEARIARDAAAASARVVAQQLQAEQASAARRRTMTVVIVLVLVAVFVAIAIMLAPGSAASPSVAG